MFRSLRTIIASFGVLVAQQAYAETAQETVLRFANTFLGSAAHDRLADPIGTDYEHLYEIDATTLNASEAQTLDEKAWIAFLSNNLHKLDDTAWGQFLIEEMLMHSDKAIWLDWKYNVLTMVRDDDWDNQLGLIFSKYGAAPLTDEERTPILEKAHREHGDWPEVLMMEEQQPLAEKRGYRLMFFENQSDGLALFMLPSDQADQWHMTQLGNILIINADAGVVSDPRNGGKPVRLTN